MDRRLGHRDKIQDPTSHQHQSSSIMREKTQSARTERDVYGKAVAPPKHEVEADEVHKSTPVTQTEGTGSSRESTIELPLSQPCRGGCSFYGSSKSGGLCSKCAEAVEDGATNISDKQVISYLLEKCGYKSAAEVRHEICFDQLYPDAAFHSPAEIPGVRAWQTTRRPVTQFDAVPEKGDTACTFIAAITAIRLAWWHRTPNAFYWAVDIETGVEAFHMCRKQLPHSDEPLYRNVTEVLEFVLPAVGYPPNLKSVANFKEVVVGLCVPAHLSKSEFIQFLGPNGYQTIGVDGVVEVMESIFKSYGQEVQLDDGVAVVVTRPPETYVIVKGDGPAIFFRDSHRRTQFDFDSVEPFLEWVRRHPSYFAPMSEDQVGVSLNNQVGLYSIVHTVEAGIADAIMDPKNGTWA